MDQTHPPRDSEIYTLDKQSDRSTDICEKVNYLRCLRAVYFIHGELYLEIELRNTSNILSRTHVWEVALVDVDRQTGASCYIGFYCI